MRRDDEAGITLVEVLLAVFILAVVLLALASSATASLVSLTSSQLRQQAYTAASRSIEVARTLPFSELRLLDPPDQSAFDSLGADDQFDPVAGTLDTPGSGEVVLRTNVPEDAGFEDSPHRIDGSFTLRTIPTVPVGGNIDDLVQVRITVVVEFELRGRVERVRQSTLVTRPGTGVAGGGGEDEASNSGVVYGLEQPSFSVAPVVRGLDMERGQESCVDHRVTNQGSSDRYRLDRPSSVVHPEFSLEAFVIGEDGTEMLWLDGEWTHTVQVGSSVDIRICYVAGSTAASVDDLDFRVVSQDALDEATDADDQVDPVQLEGNSQRLFHTVSIETSRVLYLAGPPLPRDPAVSAALVTDPPTGVPVTNLDPQADDRAGLLLLPGDGAAWRTTFEGPRTITGLDLVLWTSSPGALDGDLLEPQSQDYVIQVRRVTPDGEATIEHDSTIGVSTSDLGWTQRAGGDWYLTLAGGDISVSSGDAIELIVVCAATSQTACNLGLASEPHPARLQMDFP